MKQKFDITGMTCSACSAHVEKSVKKLTGMEAVTVNLLQNSMTAEFDEASLNTADIVRAVENAGYGAAVQGGQKAEAHPNNVASDALKAMRFRLVVSVLLLLPLMYLSMGHMMGLPLPQFFHGTENAIIMVFTQFLLTLPIMYVNRTYYIGGLKSLAKGAPNMDTLIAVGSGAAVVYGIYALYAIGWGLGHGEIELVSRFQMDLYFESAGMIVTLITCGKYMETRSKGKTSEAITKLMDLSPKQAVVLRDGAEHTVPVEQLQKGDIVVVRAGQAVPADGVVASGSAAVDESALTGESIPAEKEPGAGVTGGTVCRTGYFHFEVTKTGEDTALAQIIHLMEEAAGLKAPIAKLADRVSGVFVPIVMGIAVLTALIWLLVGKSFDFALSAGIAVLVVSCPCALGLATPTAIMVGTGKGAEYGILVKSAEALEIAHTVQTVVLDKTGTVTQGKPQVTDIHPADGVTVERLLAVAASIEKPSGHPLADAVVRLAEERNIVVMEATAFEAVAGRGLRAVVDGQNILAGNRTMMEENGVKLAQAAAEAERMAQEGKTPLYFSADGKLLGLLALADVVKPTSARAIRELRGMGMEVVLLTGDNQVTAEAIGRQLGVKRVIAGVLPQDKEKEIRRLQETGSRVIMVGDGINDAPALARADVGIAIGAGTDVAMESADIVLMKSDLMDAVTAVQLSKSVIRNIRENLFWAFFYNIIGIPVAAGVFYPMFGWLLSPMFAAAAMSLSSVCVVSNALRLKLFRPRYRTQPEQETLELNGSSAAQPHTVINNQQQKGRINMKKTLTVEGMSCGHCSARVEKALNELEGVSAWVELEKKAAYVEASAEIADSVLIKAVEDAGYEVTAVE